MVKVLVIFCLFYTCLGFSQDQNSFDLQKQLDSLNTATSNLIELGRYYLALQLNKKADSILLKNLDSISVSAAYYSLNKGRVDAFYNRAVEAEKNLIKAKLIFKQELGSSHPAYIKCIHSLGIFYRGSGSYNNAALSYEELKIVLSKTYGKRDSQYIACLNEMGLLFKDDQKYNKAEQYLLEAKKIQSLILKPDHPDLASTLNNLAILYKNMGRYPEAIYNYSEALRIRELHLGKQHVLYTSVLLNLANLYIDLGNYQMSEKTFLEAIKLREKEHGNRHPYYATSIEWLALLYKDMGIYSKAIEYSMDANNIRAASLGENSVVYAGGLSNLAQIYTLAGYYNEALLQYQKALAIYKSNLGKEHLKYLECLNRMAVLYTYRGNYSKARSNFEELLTTRGQLFGSQNTQYADALVNLAFLFNEMGICDSSELKLLESLKINQLVLGPQHHKCAQVMEKLAELYKVPGKVQQADSLFRIVKNIRARMLGSNHKLYSQSLDHLAEINEIQKKYSDSDKFLKELNELDQERMRNAISFLSEVELANYSESFQHRTSELGTYILSRPIASVDNLTRLVLDNALFSKGFLMSTAARFNQLSTEDPRLTDYITSLRSIRKQLAVEYTKPKAEQRNVSKLESNANSIEKKLRRLSLDFLKATQKIRWQDLRDLLKPEEAAIEFIQFQMPIAKNQFNTMYAAILLRSDSKSPRFIILCNESDLDSLIKSEHKPGEGYINAIYGLYNRGAMEVKVINKSLYALIWKPIESELNGVKTIYYSPGGLIHRINLSAILNTKSSILADQYQLIELNSTRQLALPDQFQSTNNEAILYGGIFYEVQDTAPVTKPLDKQLADNSFTFSVASRGSDSWDFLDGTELEVNALHPILTAAGLKVTLKTGFDATEESFKALGAWNSSSPRIINLSTHGFFFSDTDRTISAEGRMSHDPANSSGTASEGTAKAASLSSNLKFEATEPVFKISDHPMLRSGLIMSGGNAAWQGKTTATGREDGILTAYEIAQMNLSNTELVVLSACETGLGDIQGNEGVYGLQRAFKIAGVKYLIMSLWKVPDLETAEFMISFYKFWLEPEDSEMGKTKRSIPEAFRMAQKAMRERFKRPFQWAGFVLVE